MSEMPFLSAPVPPPGRYMLNSERLAFNKATNNKLKLEDSRLVYITSRSARLGCDNSGRYIFLLRGRSLQAGIKCLIAEVPRWGRNLSQGEVKHARRAGMSCSECTFVRPDPAGNILVFKLPLRWIGANPLLPYEPRPAGCKPQPQVSEVNGCRRVPILRRRIPERGRCLSAGEQAAVRRLAPWLGTGAGLVLQCMEGGLLLDSGYQGNYLLVRV